MAYLEFTGKRFVQNYHLTVPHRKLEIDKKKSLTEAPGLDDNIIVHGDNLEALKSLMPHFAGKVKCIYIDPPYNTGKESWIYTDRVNYPYAKDWFGSKVSFEDSNRHDKWLCMMTPRLRLLRELMRDDGVILISIDDNEQEHLRMLMDEVFGEANFVAQLVWEKGRKNDARFFSVGHEYMMVFARDYRVLKESKVVWREPKPGSRELWNEYVKLKKELGDDFDAIQARLTSWFPSLPEKHPSKKLARYKRVDAFGPWRDRDISWPGGGGPRYDVMHPITKKACKVPERGWGFASPEEMQRQIDLGLVEFRDNESEPPFRKAHLKPVPEELSDDAGVEQDEDPELTELATQVRGSYFYAQSQVAVKYLRQLMGGKVFPNPKDHNEIAKLLNYVSPDSDTIFLDSFAGSGTTAHAVLALNKEDGGNRKFILVEQEDYADKITAERVRRVIKGVKTAKDENLKKGLGGSFTYYELGESFDEQKFLSGNNLPDYKEMAGFIWSTLTGNSIDEKKIKEKKQYIGETDKFEVYLIYEPDLERLKKDVALTLDWLKKLPEWSGKKKRLVFAPVKWMSSDVLYPFGVEYVQLPYEIYRRIEK